MSIAALTLTLLAAPLPDALDHLKAVDVVPNIGLLLDASCSMSYNPRIATTCSWFAANYTSNNLSMTKNQVMRAALVGCQSANDGILDKWSSRVNFSLFDFGRSSTDATMRAPFGSTKAALETAALAVPATGSTPLTKAIREHGRYFGQYFTNSNTLQCRPNFILLLTDGDPNGGAATFDYNCAVSGDPFQSLYVSATQPWLGSDYLTRHRDLMCSLTGEQKIRTYTLGFGAPGSYNPTNLANIASRGLGQAFYATNLTELDASLSQMIGAMVARSAVFTAAPSIERDGLYNGNYFYAPAFRSERQGRWAGTVKKYCIEPTRTSAGSYDTDDRRCIFASDDGHTLMTNPVAEDLWTGTTTTAADQGGAGLLMLSALGTAGGAPGSNPWGRRRLQSWRPGTAAYVDVTPSTWTADDSYSSGLGHNKLVNLLHGYTYDANADGTPKLISEWPYGDTIHVPTALLRYGADCQVAGQCFLVVGANDGQLHVHDAATGVETTALVPAELWRPLGVASDQLRAMSDQPALDSTHRYYIDGGLSVFHEDANGDAIIQPGETAHLVFGLGRGGSAYYQIPVSDFDGIFDADDNPIRALTGLPGTGSAELGETWATPWLGAPELGASRPRVAIFPSGHHRRFDDPTASLPGPVTVAARLGGTTSRACTTVATSLSLPASICGNYGASAYPDASATNTTLGPIVVPNVAGYRLTFTTVDIDTNDRLVIQDAGGNEITSISGRPAVPWVSPWLYGDRISFRWVTNGSATSHRGWTLGTIEQRDLIPATTRTHTPGVYMVDLDRWNGTSPRNFQSESGTGATILEIAEVCTTSPSICVDAISNPDLRNMKCPISTEISVLPAGERIAALYWGDECGQLWKAWPSDQLQTTWRAKRLLKLTNTDPSSGATYGSKDYRKVFRRLDLVPSSCPGKRVTGVYFGTGNVQRPTATDELANTTLTVGGRDVVGVVWDSSTLPTGASLAQLTDVTSAVSSDPRAANKHGWYWSLTANERMLRDPLVFDGVAYFKTFRAVNAAHECTNSTGVDTVYAVDNCTAEPVIEGPVAGMQLEDRVAWDGNTDVGGNLMLITTKTGQPLVTVGNLSRAEAAQIVPEDRGRVPRIFHWREPRRD